MCHVAGCEHKLSAKLWSRQCMINKVIVYKKKSVCNRLNELSGIRFFNLIEKWVQWEHCSLENLLILKVPIDQYDDLNVAPRSLFKLHSTSWCRENSADGCWLNHFFIFKSRGLNSVQFPKKGGTVGERFIVAHVCVCVFLWFRSALYSPACRLPL